MFSQEQCVMVYQVTSLYHYEKSDWQEPRTEYRKERRRWTLLPRHTTYNHFLQCLALLTANIIILLICFNTILTFPTFWIGHARVRPPEAGEVTRGWNRRTMMEHPNWHYKIKFQSLLQINQSRETILCFLTILEYTPL